MIAAVGRSDRGTIDPGLAEEEGVGFNPMQGRRPKAGDLAVLQVSLGVLAVNLLWGFRVI
jgi:hypothetical protein